MKEEISKHYNPQDVEPKWLAFWEKEGVFSFDPKAKGDIYSIDTPPPYVSGRMHTGHSYSYSHEDFMARYFRMRGYNVFYPFGTDDNGLPTERFVEKQTGKSASRMKRSEFIKLCIKMINELSPIFIEDWKRLGMSCDFSKIYSTIDDHSRKISQIFFIDLYNNNNVYRKKAPVIWCPRCQTALAQADLEDKDAETLFNDLVFNLKNGKNITISTTRPELLPSCAAIFVHPKDKRFKNLVGKKARVPIFGNWVEIKTDPEVDMKKGTGAVMCCTFGDKADVEWFKKHELPLVVSVDKAGRMTGKAKKYKNLSLKEAREKIISDLKKKKLIIGQKKISHAVNIHERCKTEAEILESEQWYIRILDKKKEFRELGKKIKWHPEFMRTRYENWIKGLSWDWAISRQRFFGVPFPLWYCQKCGEVKLAEEKDLPIDPLSKKPKGKCEKCKSSKFVPEKDVMDTWATSSLTPQLALNLFYDKKASEKMIPMTLRPQAHDIISTWLFYTVVRSFYHCKKEPWKKIMISGHVLDPQGRKMSKSLGNAVEPREIIEDFGADALRYWAAGRSLGQNINYSKEELRAGKKFLTKTWNATRFVMMNLDSRLLKAGSSRTEIKKKSLHPTDQWILAELQEVIESATKSFEKYDYSAAKMSLEKFFWIKLTDNYIEIVKNRLYDKSRKNKPGRDSAQFTLYSILFTILRLLSPFVPFATEEIYQTFFKTKKCAKSIHLCGWPEVNPDLRDPEKVKNGKILLQIIALIRKHKAQKNLSMKVELEKVEIACDAKTKKFLKKTETDLKAVGNIANLKYKNSKKLAVKISQSH